MEKSSLFYVKLGQRLKEREMGLKKRGPMEILKGKKWRNFLGRKEWFKVRRRLSKSKHKNNVKVVLSMFCFFTAYLPTDLVLHVNCLSSKDIDILMGSILNNLEAKPYLFSQN